MKQSKFEQLQKKIPHLQAKSVLDLGAGEGLNRAYFPNWVGVDKFGSEGIIEDDMYHFLQNDERKFDLIISEFSLQYDKALAPKIVNQIYKHLNPNGYFYMAGFNEATLHGKWFSQEEWFSFMRGKVLLYDRFEVYDPPHVPGDKPHSHNVTEFLVQHEKEI